RFHVGHFEDRSGEVVPGTRIRVGDVIEAKCASCNYGSDCRCDVHRVARRTDLVRHDAQRLAHSGDAQPSFDEVAAFTPPAPNSIQAARSDDEVAGTDGANQVFAGELTQAVDADRAGGVVFLPGSPPRIFQTKDIVRAEVDERAIQVAADDGQVAD